jgi:hypothetical protein
MSEKMDLTTSQADADQEFRHYQELYSAYLDEEIRWSEARFLSPQYLHLHEEDIKHAGDYKLHSYVRSFINNLGGLKDKLESIVFCYSFENEAPQTPKNCEQNKFFYYRLQLPRGRDVDDDDVAPSEGEAGRRPPLMDISKELSDVLSGYDVIQPYIIQEVAPGQVKCRHNIMPTASRSELEELVNAFKEKGCYQFTIYGYRLTNEAKKHNQLSRAELLFLEHAFIMHILNWNFDLRSAHQIRSDALSGITQDTRKEWNKLKTNIDGVLDRIEAMSGLTEQAESLGVLPAYEYMLHLETGMFRTDWGHDVSAFDVSHFEDFVLLTRKPAPANIRRLMRFVQKCGAHECLVQLENEEKTKENEAWARGIWFATKLLTRRLNNPNLESPEGIGPDQVALVVIFGLVHVGLKDVPFAIRFQFQPNEELDENECYDRFLTAVRLRGKDDPKNPWGAPGWSCQSTTDGKQMQIDWQSDSARPAETLKDFVRHGLIRCEEHLPTGCSLMIPGCQIDPQVFSRFLTSLMGFLLAAASPSASTRGFRVKAVKLEYNVSEVGEKTEEQGGGSYDAHMILSLLCSDSIPFVDGTSEEGGDLKGPLVRLLRCFGQSRLLLLPDNPPPGIYVKPEDAGWTRLVIILKSDNRVPWSNQ